MGVQLESVPIDRQLDTNFATLEDVEAQSPAGKLDPDCSVARLPNEGEKAQSKSNHAEDLANVLASVTSDEQVTNRAQLHVVNTTEQLDVEVTLCGRCCLCSAKEVDARY